MPASRCAQADAADVETPKGTWFDEAVDLRDPEGEALTKEALALIAAVETRSRKRRQADERNHQAAVRRVLANGLRCRYFRRPSFVAYFRRADSYGDGPAWLSGKAMARTVDLLAEAGLLNARCGKLGSAASTYSVTEKLCGVAQACGATHHSLTIQLPLQRLVRLRKGDAQTPLVDFGHTAETLHWTSRLRAYNAFLVEQDIGLALTLEEEAEWVRRWNENREGESVSLYRPELIQTDLYRQFNNGSFGQGGRLYGGWWINTPKALRRKITINGEPTVELDFSGCAIRMLYHERGLDYQGDPYLLDAVAAYEAKRGLAPGHFRAGVKAMTQALINDRNGKRPEMIRLPAGLSFRPGFKRAEVRRIIEEKHASIADAFGTGAGLRLQRCDSDIALAIITKLREQNVVSLPIHDSFLIRRRDGFRASATMSMLYRLTFGFDPVIKVSP
ncbi:hypothetical protein [Phenylobacterium sp.]|uniref:hypothetical protein n=1 Tax=Phenylobacterium sp. TaxID=1871053 RepID=UPI0035AFA0E5